MSTKYRCGDSRDPGLASRSPAGQAQTPRLFGPQQTDSASQANVLCCPPAAANSCLDACSRRLRASRHPPFARHLRSSPTLPSPAPSPPARTARWTPLTQGSTAALEGSSREYRGRLPSLLLDCVARTDPPGTSVGCGRHAELDCLGSSSSILPRS